MEPSPLQSGRSLSWGGRKLGSVRAATAGSLKCCQVDAIRSQQHSFPPPSSSLGWPRALLAPGFTPYQGLLQNIGDQCLQLPKLGCIRYSQALTPDQRRGEVVGMVLVQGSALWVFAWRLDRSSSNISSSKRGKAGVWVSCWVSFKANLILYIKVVFLLKNVKNDPGRSEQLFPGGDRRDESLLQKAVSTLSPATAIHKLKNKSITRVNELKMSMFKMYQEKNC